MLSFADAHTYASRLHLRPGYTMEVDGSLVLVSVTGPNAYREGNERQWWWSFRLDLPDLENERTLLRRLVLGLVELDLHEHLEHLTIDGVHPVEPHRDPNAIEMTEWPGELRQSSLVPAGALSDA